MMRKSMKVTLCAALVFSLMALAACGGKESKDSVVKPPSAAETKAPDTEAAGTEAPDSESSTAAETEASDSESSTAAETKAPDSESSAAAETSAAQSGGTTSSGKYATVADFANSSEVQTQLEIQKKSLDGTGMDIAITGEDNKLIYTFTYQELENQEGMAEALEQGLEGQKSTFVSVAKSIKLAVEIENPVVVVQYLDAKGEVIYSAEFTAD